MFKTRLVLMRKVSAVTIGICTIGAILMYSKEIESIISGAHKIKYNAQKIASLLIFWV